MLGEYNNTITPVSVDFKKLLPWIKSGDQLTHQIHSYPAKLIPHIANFFINNELDRGKCPVVLDPFCGSGTVALEASLLGCTSYIADANPFALMLAQVKTTPYSIEDLNYYLEFIIFNYKKSRNKFSVDIINVDLWYEPNIKFELDKIIHIIKDINNEDIQNFFKICFSYCAKRLSFADPAISVPVRLKVKESFSDSRKDKIIKKFNWLKTIDVLNEFIKISKENINRVAVTNNKFPSRSKAHVVGKDVRLLHKPSSENDILPCNSIPLIITSPPYGSAQKYIRSCSLSLNWLELASPHTLKNLEQLSIGREHVSRASAENIDFILPQEFEALISEIKTINPVRARITEKYLFEMNQACAEIARVLSIGGKAIIVVGNNQVCNKVLRNDSYLTYCLENYGLVLELSLIDDIKSRGLMTKRNRTASTISRECVLVFTKVL